MTRRLPLCVAMLIAAASVGCEDAPLGDGPIRVTVGGDAGPRADGACFGIDEGCSCDSASARPIDCYLDPIVASGHITCNSGTRYCRNDAWTGCESIRSFVLGGEASALITGPDPCNPCDPRCYSHSDTPGPGDLPGRSTGLTYDPGAGGVGLTPSAPITPPLPDSDGDGIPDVADSCVGPGAFLAADGSCYGDVFFYHTLPFGGPAVFDPLAINLQIRTADVYFLIDTTGSMGGELTRLRTDLTTGNFHPTMPGCGNGVLGAIRCAIPDAWFGVGFHDDYPVNPFGGATDFVFRSTADISSPLLTSQTAINALVLHWGNDGPESNTQAFWATATGGSLGPYLNARTSCPTAGGWGAPCFRAGTIPIIIHVTDAPFHNGPANAYPYNFTWGGGSTAVTGNDNTASAYVAFPVLGSWGVYTGSSAGMVNDATDGFCGSSGAPDSFFAFDVPAGPDQLITISTEGSTYNTVLGLYRSTAPAPVATSGNETFATATVDATPTGVLHSYTGTTTTMADDIAPGCGAAGRDATWRFTLPAAATVTVDTVGSAFDTTLSLWSLSAATAVAGNESVSYTSAYNVGAISAASNVSYSGNTSGMVHDHSAAACGSVTARDAAFRFSLASTQTLAITTEGSAYDTVLSLYQMNAFAAAAGNDTYATAYNATTSLGSNRTFTGSTATMANDITATCGGGTARDSVFVLNSPAVGSTLNVDTIGSGFDTVLSLFRLMTMPAVGATVAVTGNENFVGSEYSINAGVALPGGFDQSFTGNTGAMTANRVPTCGNAGRDAAFRFVVPAGGATVTIDTEGSAFDTVLGIYNSASVQVGCDDDSGSGTLSFWTGALAAGTYYVLVDGWGASAGAYRMRVRTAFTAYTEVACDDNTAGSGWSRFSGVALAASTTYYLVVDGAGAANGNYRLNFGTGSGYSQIGCDDDGFGSGGLSRMTPTLAAGDYFVVVDGRGTASGAYRLNFGNPLAQITCNDDFAGLGALSRITQALAAGTYYVVLDGWSGASGAYSVNFGTGASTSYVACNDDGVGIAPQSVLQQTLTPGRYYVAVDGRGSVSGTYTIAIGQTPPVMVPVPGPVSWTDTVNALNARDLRVITMQTCGNWTSAYCLEGEAHARALGNATGSLCANPTGCGGGVANGAPFVFRGAADGSGLSSAIVNAVVQLAAYSTMDISARAVGDTQSFTVLPIAAVSFGPGTCSGIISGSTFDNCTPGTSVNFNVSFRNTTVMPTAVPQIFDFFIEVVGDGTVVLARIPVRIVVPPSIPTYPVVGTYTQTYDTTARCDITERPDWGTLGWNVTVPVGTSVRFDLRAADSLAALPTSTPIASRTVTTSGTGSDLITPLLTGAGIAAGRRYLQLTANLFSDPTRTFSPVLTSANITYTCIPAE